MIKDNYAKNIFYIMMITIFLFVFWIGLISGVIIMIADDKLHDIERDNLIKIYQVAELE